MVKTTLEIKSEVYRKLVEASLRKYGNTKSLSKIANEVIEEHLKEETPDDIKTDVIERTFGSWKIEETGEEYTEKIRKGWSTRAKRLDV